MTSPDTTAEEISLEGMSLPESLPVIEGAIVRAAAGEPIDLTTSDDVVVKYVVPTAAVRGVRSSFQRDEQHGWRVRLRPRRVAVQE